MKPFLGKRYTKIGSAHHYISSDRAKAVDKICEEILPYAKYVSNPCLCNTVDKKDIVLAEIDRWGLPARSVLCLNCGLIRIDPRWDDQTYTSIYAKYFWPLQIGF